MTRLITAAIVSLLLTVSAHAELRITRDFGGRIGTYVDKYQGVRNSGEQVVIDGPCLSACTIVLSAVPKERICVTSHASLGFHAAWDFGQRGQQVTNPEATRMLYAMYPHEIKRWINGRGGLRKNMVFLSGKRLARMYAPCRTTQQPVFANASWQ